MPRAATSVATKILVWPLRNESKRRIRTACGIAPCKALAS